MGEIVKFLIPRAEAARLIGDGCGINGTYWLDDNARGRHGGRWKVPYIKRGNRFYYDPADIARVVKMKRKRLGDGNMSVTETLGIFSPLWSVDIIKARDGSPFVNLVKFNNQAMSLDDTRKLIMELVEVYKEAKAQQATSKVRLRAFTDDLVARSPVAVEAVCGHFFVER